MKTGKLSQQDIQNIILFTETVVEELRDKLQAEFVCPICGGQAYAAKDPYDGHHRAVCKKCKMNFIE